MTISMSHQDVSQVLQDYFMPTSREQNLVALEEVSVKTNFK